LIPGLAENVQAAVHHGHVTLTGTVEWLYQRQRAEAAVRLIRGIRGAFNHVRVRPKSGQRDVQRRITRALHHNADIDAQHISVAVKDDTATLGGTVMSWMQRESAERAAGSAPGIAHVDNQISVVPAEPHEFEPPDDIY
jgi:osmotically-inducible protein OsmY